MKKVLFTIICICNVLFCYPYERIYLEIKTIAGFYEEPQAMDQNDIKIRHRAPMVMPSVSYDESGIYIQCISILYNVEVIINDGNGNCLLSTITDVGNETFIELSETANLVKYSIELIYGDIHLYGEF